MKKFRSFVSLVALALVGLTTIAEAQENRYVRIINRSSDSIRYFYASNVDRTVWEEDILGPMRIIAPGHYVDVNIDDHSGHCLFDLKAVLWDGRVATERRFNVCTNSSWTVVDRN